MKFTYREVSAAIRSGDDSKVLSYLYATILPKVRKHIIRHSGSKEEADDIFQDAVLILYKNSMEGKLDNVVNMEAFLFQITKNLWINHVRKAGKISSISIQEAELESGEKNVVENILTEERRLALVELFEMVGEKCCRVMELHLFEKKSMEEISTMMGFSGANAAKAQHYRCKQKLIDLMAEHPHLNSALIND